MGSSTYCTNWHSCIGSQSPSQTAPPSHCIETGTAAQTKQKHPAPVSNHQRSGTPLVPSAEESPEGAKKKVFQQTVENSEGLIMSEQRHTKY